MCDADNNCLPVIQCLIVKWAIIRRSHFPTHNPNNLTNILRVWVNGVLWPTKFRPRIPNRFWDIRYLNNYILKKSKNIWNYEKKNVGKMGFPHLPKPPEPSLALWLWRFFFENCLLDRPFLYLFTNKYAANLLCYRFRRSLTNWRNNEGRPFCSPKFHKKLFYKDYEHGCPTFNRSPQINVQIHKKRHSSHVELNTVFNKFQ